MTFYEANYADYVDPGVLSSIQEISAINAEGYNPKLLEKLTQLFVDSSDLRLKETVGKTINSFGTIGEKRGLISQHLNELVGSDTKTRATYSKIAPGKPDAIAWFSDPQIFSGPSTRNIKELQFQWKSIPIALPAELQSRVRNDLVWTLNNCCAGGINENDLFHGHLCFPQKLQYEENRIVTGIEEIDKIEDLINGLLDGTTFKGIKGVTRSQLEECLGSSPKINNLKSRLIEAVAANMDKLFLLFHSFERVDDFVNHPWFVNRTILTDPKGDKSVAHPLFSGFGVGSSQMKLREVSLYIDFKTSDKHDKELRDLEAVATFWH